MSSEYSTYCRCCGADLSRESHASDCENQTDFEASMWEEPAVDDYAEDQRILADAILDDLYGEYGTDPAEEQMLRDLAEMDECQHCGARMPRDEIGESGMCVPCEEQFQEYRPRYEEMRNAYYRARQNSYAGDPATPRYISFAQWIQEEVVADPAFWGDPNDSGRSVSF